MTEHSIPQDFYVYAHHRADTGEIFYIGKGKKRRAWDTKHGRSKHWKALVAKHGFEVRILQSGLQDWAARELECDMIALHGRRDLGHGPLVNFTDGGDGAAGIVHTDARKQAARSRMLKRLQDPDLRAKYVAALRTYSKTEKAVAANKAQARKLQSPTISIKRVLALKNKFMDVEYRALAAARMKAKNADPLFAAKRDKALIARNATIETKEARTQHLKARWEKEENKDNARAVAAKHLHSEATKKKVLLKLKIYNSNKDMQAERLRKSKAAVATAIQCELTGARFKAIVDAVEWLKLNGKPAASSGNIVTCCKKGRGTAYGYAWRYVDPQK